MGHIVIRRQLSMYVPAGDAQDIERVRAAIDPVQRRLIPAHVTLCREDELGDTAALQGRLACLAGAPLRLTFGAPQRFSQHGILLACIAGEPLFRQLREYVLQSTNCRNHVPHMTLAHPRNPPFDGDSLAIASTLAATMTIDFPTIRLIEQTGGGPWQELALFNLPAGVNES